ncbi:RsmB/NOP family class I SAM-dependent RNA methyltransferase [Oceaniglobus ichthyenteri]|uniref:RsmB/NOP family class I SAM-dependent RNA methyltransferase n=1 Tax=Oceaniglobus ichthyenteri TaxID=2136177 RepID=UPI000D3C71B0|nr:RsmB/NOP family class I SAM-dependent RNA methyltransferase [Oceaniglobus ichthyenteri]
MTPGARVAAAIEILDRINEGAAAEQVLTHWARQNRFAGSSDRAAIRDHVFDVLRQYGTCSALGGGATGRQLMIGLMRRQGIACTTVFTGVGHAPAPLDEDETASPDPVQVSATLDYPEWLLPQLKQSLGDEFEQVLTLFQSRAPMFLRVNTAKSTMDEAQQALAEDGIVTEPSALADTALVVVKNPRRVQANKAFLDGWVEVQDAASQAITARVPLKQNQRVLDYCAGGGGKTLALAARCPDATFYAHDADPARIGDLPKRAARAGVDVTILTPSELPKSGPFDVVVVDAPCSGSGAWRRSPQGKWALNAEKLNSLIATQAQILHDVVPLVDSGGILAYMTCSVLTSENEVQVQKFCQNNLEWKILEQRSVSPLAGGDGFYVAILKRL